MKPIVVSSQVRLYLKSTFNTIVVDPKCFTIRNIGSIKKQNTIQKNTGEKKSYRSQTFVNILLNYIQIQAFKEPLKHPESVSSSSIRKTISNSHGEFDLSH